MPLQAPIGQPALCTRVHFKPFWPAAALRATDGRVGFHVLLHFSHEIRFLLYRGLGTQTVRHFRWMLFPASATARYRESLSRSGREILNKLGRSDVR
jgi:hypothetical protein